MLPRSLIQVSRSCANGVGTGDGGSPRRSSTWFPEQYLVPVGDDFIEGEPDDPAQTLRVKQDDDSGDPGSQREIVTGEQTAEQGHALALRQRSVPDDGGSR
jgi:hypothetical protein